MGAQAKTTDHDHTTNGSYPKKGEKDYGSAFTTDEGGNY